MNLTAYLLKRTAALFLGAFLLIGVTPTKETHTVKDGESCLLNFTVLSDAHMEGNNRPYRERFIQTLYDVKNTQGGNDALIFLGDSTMNGQHIENLFFYGIFSHIRPVPPERLYMTIGNHDSGNGIGKDRELRRRFWDYVGTFTSRSVDEPYYYYDTIKDCYFIFLTTTGDEIHLPNFGQEQAEWLDTVLSIADSEAKAAFVFAHHPYIGEIYDVLKAHKNVVFFSGHTHTSRIDIYRLDEDSYTVNLPKCTELPYSDETQEGQGLQVEMYDGEIVLRARNFYESQWGTEYTLDIN